MTVAPLGGGEGGESGVRSRRAAARTIWVSPSSRWACRAISSRPSPRARRWSASGLACSVLARNVAGCNNRVLGGGLAMASFVQRALMYLGLKDIDDEDDYDNEEEEVGETPAGRVRQSSYPEPAPPRASVATVRPIARDDGREPSTPVARGAVVRPFVTQRHTKPQVVAPARFSDAQEIGDMVKASAPVIVNLQASEKDLARRMIDFCSGLTYARRRIDGEGRRIGVPPDTVERRGLPRGAPAPAGERAVPVLRPTASASLRIRSVGAPSLDLCHRRPQPLLVHSRHPGRALLHPGVDGLGAAAGRPVLRGDHRAGARDPCAASCRRCAWAAPAVDLSPIIVWVVILIVRGLL